MTKRSAPCRAPLSPKEPSLSPKPLPKRLYALALAAFFPVYYSLYVIGAHVWGYGLVTACFIGLMALWRQGLWHGWRCAICFLLAMGVSIGALYISRPRQDVSLPGQIGSGTVRVFTRLFQLDTQNSTDMLPTGFWEPPEGYDLTIVSLNTCQAELLTRNGSQSPYAVLQLHGGAFVSGLFDVYRFMAVRYCDMAQGAAVLTVDYRLFPQYAYPSQQNDVMDAWSTLTQPLGYSPKNILVAGDSAGGNLALNLALRLRDEGAEMPAALVLLSPWADLSNAGASHIDNATKDPTFGLPASEWDGLTPVGVKSTYADGLNARDPYLSPSYADYAGFPPMLLQAGELEVLLSDSEAIYQNALAHGVDVTFTVYPGMFHVFQGSLDLLPESREAWAEIAAFVQRTLKP